MLRYPEIINAYRPLVDLQSSRLLRLVRYDSRLKLGDCVCGRGLMWIESEEASRMTGDCDQICPGGGPQVNTDESTSRTPVYGLM